MRREIVKIERVKDYTREKYADEGFLALKRLKLKNKYADGGESPDYSCEFILRKGLDAVGVALYSRRPDGGIDVHLVRAFRPAVTMRPFGPEESPFLDEIVAGIIEPDDERGEAGIRKRASEETLEEAGFEVAPEDFFFLGSALFPTPGAHTEKLHFVAAKVDAAKQIEPTRDGSVYESESYAVKYDFADALKMCDDGLIKDAKTEIALYRLCRRLSAAPQAPIK